MQRPREAYRPKARKGGKLFVMTPQMRRKWHRRRRRALFKYCISAAACALNNGSADLVAYSAEKMHSLEHLAGEQSDA